jgi:4-hydroxy-3-polyprenylbenzoate decarboxylase
VHGADLKSDVGAITEITAWSSEHPLVLFDAIDGHPGARIGVHSFDSYRRMQLIYGFPDGLRGKELTQWWRGRLDAYAPVPPVTVDEGPVLQNVLERRRGRPAPLPGAGVARARRRPLPRDRRRVGAARPGEPGGSTSAATGHARTTATRSATTVAGGHNGQVIRDRWFARGENCPS